MTGRVLCRILDRYKKHEMNKKKKTKKKRNNNGWFVNIDGSHPHQPNNVIHFISYSYEARTHNIAFYGIFKWLSVSFFSFQSHLIAVFSWSSCLVCSVLCSRPKWINHLNSNKIEFFFNAKNLRSRLDLLISSDLMSIRSLRVCVSLIVLLQHAYLVCPPLFSMYDRKRVR